jgi:ribonuclease III
MQPLLLRHAGFCLPAALPAAAAAPRRQRCCAAAHPPPSPRRRKQQRLQPAQAAAAPPGFQYRGEPPHGAPQETIVVRRAAVDRLEHVLLLPFGAVGRRELLVQAMIHKSCVGARVELEVGEEEWEGVGGGAMRLQDVSHLESNERLEWLGDRVYGLKVAAFLYAARPGLQEGALSTLLAGLVSRRRANQIAVSLGLADLLVCSKYVPPHPTGEVSARLGCFWEALLGALYLAGGDAAVDALFEARVKPLLHEMLGDGDKNWKGDLLELLTRHGLRVSDGDHVRFSDLTLEPRDEESMLRTGALVFRVGLFVHNARAAVAVASSKRKASQAAARSLLERLEAAEDVAAVLEAWRAEGIATR